MLFPAEIEVDHLVSFWHKLNGGLWTSKCKTVDKHLQLCNRIGIGSCFPFLGDLGVKDLLIVERRTTQELEQAEKVRKAVLNGSSECQSVSLFETFEEDD